MQSVFRFAPSPNGYLHLGHAYSALLNAALAQAAGGRFLLRIEDIDLLRCRPALIDAAFEDLAWLGLAWEQPVLRQSSQFARYRAALDDLSRRGLVYPCFCTRKQAGAGAERHDPDGAPVYRGACRVLPPAERARRIAGGAAYALRLDMAAALRLAGPLTWDECGAGETVGDAAAWGDVVLGRKDTPTSYHLAVVMDDALQGVTDVVRGKDLYAATAIHRVLQALLGLPAPRYRHHDLLRDAAGAKLAKSKSAAPLRQLRAEGMRPEDIRVRLGF